MDSPIETAEKLVEEIRHSKTQKDRAAFAILHQEEAASCIEKLIIFHQGYVDGSTAEASRLAKAASALLSEIFKLRAALRVRENLGLPTNEQESFTKEWVTGSAPRLFVLADQLREMLQK